MRRNTNNITDDLTLEEQLINGIAYREKSIKDNTNHSLQEIVSDMPHALDFTQSLMVLAPITKELTSASYNSGIIPCINDIKDMNSFYESCSQIIPLLTQINIPTSAFDIFPTLILSGIGLYSAKVNLQTLMNEKTAQKKEQKSQIRIFQHFQKSNSPQTIDEEAALEITGFPDTGVRTIDKKTIEKIDKRLNQPLSEKTRGVFHTPVSQLLKTSISATSKFTLVCAKDILLNYSNS